MLTLPATAADIPALVRLVNSAYRGDASRAGWTTEAALIEGQRVDAPMLEEALAGGVVTILLGRDRPEGAIAGCVWLEPSQGGAWYLGMLSIDPRCQAQGLGRILLGAAEAFAQARGATRLRITVIHLRDALLAWYERRGYRRTGETEAFPYEDERFGRPLRDDLHFLVLEKALTAQVPGSA